MPMPGNPRGETPRCTSRPTRKAAGVPSARSQPAPVTAARPRRWGDAGTPRRECVTADQKAGAPGRLGFPQQSQTAISVSKQRQQPAAANSTRDQGQRRRTASRAAMSSRVRVHGHSGLFTKEANSRWDRRNTLQQAGCRCRHADIRCRLRRPGGGSGVSGDGDRWDGGPGAPDC